MFLAGLALISLAACGGGAKKHAAVAKAKPPAARSHASKPTAKKGTARARKPSRKAPASADTATSFNPLQSH
jgi:hypothetical protein